MFLKQKQGSIKTFYRTISTKRRRRGKAPIKPKLKKVSDLVVHTQNNSSSTSKSLSLEGLQIKSNIQKNVSSIRNILGNDQLQNEVVEKISSRQKQVQEFLLPEWLLNPFQDRERKPGIIVMDTWWYTWNIAMAFVPGLFVLLLTQYYKGEARAFYDNQQKKDRERLMDGKADEQNNIAVTHDDKSFGIFTIWDGIKSILGVNESLSDDKEELEPIQKDRNTASVEIEPMSNEPPTINDLLQRIEYLESQIKGHAQDMPRQPQSGIRTRIDERKRKRLLEEDRIIKAEEMNANTDTNILKTFVDDVQNKLKEFLQEKRIALSNHLFNESQKEGNETPSDRELHVIEGVKEEKSSADPVVHETNSDNNEQRYENADIILNDDTIIQKHGIWSKITRIWRKND
jgi:hypothetical protein